jgi:hypothetical protein
VQGGTAGFTASEVIHSLSVPQYKRTHYGQVVKRTPLWDRGWGSSTGYVG